MIDVENEELITFAQATKILPGRPNITTVWRWRNRGCRGIKLETVLSGGRRFTSIEALHRFQERVTAAADGAPINTETPRQRERAIERAEKRAAELGVEFFTPTRTAAVLVGVNNLAAMEYRAMVANESRIAELRASIAVREQHLRDCDDKNSTPYLQRKMRYWAGADVIDFDYLASIIRYELEDDRDDLWKLTRREAELSA